MSTPPPKVRRLLPAWARELDDALERASTQSVSQQAELAAWLGREVAERRRYWFRGYLPGPWSARARDVLLAAAIVLTVLSLTAFASTLLTSILGCVGGAALGLVAVVLWGAYLASIWGRSSNRQRPRGKRCPDCDYNLDGVLPAIEPAGSAGVDVGPRFCPECACGWPLVPPPVPGDPVHYRRPIQPPA